MPVLFVIGVLVQHFLIRRVLGPNDMPQIFLTFALSLLLLNLALMLFSANYRTVHTSYSDEALEAMSRLVELKLRDFGVEAEVVAVQPGAPVPVRRRRRGRRPRAMAEGGVRRVLNSVWSGFRAPKNGLFRLIRRFAPVTRNWTP